MNICGILGVKVIAIRGGQSACRLKRMTDYKWSYDGTGFALGNNR